MPLRAVFRLGSLIAVLSTAALKFGWIWIRTGGRPSLLERALWASRTSGRMCRAFGVEATVRGPVPKRGLLVSNHMGYLDIFLYSSITPCIFISKEEVRSWPLLGYLARFAGTVFIKRGSARDGSALLRQIERPLREGCLVVCFPEGTSTDGAQVKPFHPLLFEAAIRTGSAVLPAAVGYWSAEMQESQLAYWGGDALVPHLAKVSRLCRIEAGVEFGEPLTGLADRKMTAAAAREWVVASRRRISVPAGEKVGVNQ